MRARIFNIMQYEKHPETGEILLTEDTIKKALEHKSIKQYAYICHDEDVYSQRDEEDDANHIQGEKKPPHWHIVLQCSNAVDVTVIAKWFGIKEQFVDVPKGAGAFLDCVQYLTHENDKQQGLGKRLYSDDKVVANFDFRATLDKRTANRLKYGKDLDPKDQMRHDVMYGGRSLKECEDSDPITYMTDLDRLKKYRMDYISHRAPMPLLRINYYVDGKGGIGKNVACKSLAKALYPDKAEEECYFEIGGQNVSFDGYDGQPVIIWNDTRAVDLIMRFGRGEIFDIFDSHPTSAKHNIKYGSVRLVNEVNIVNGVETYSSFLNGLAGEYTDRYGNINNAEDKGQTYRRFPIILCLRETDFDVLLNKGVADGTREFQQYIKYSKLQGNFGEMAKRLSGRAREVITTNMLKPTLEATDKVKEMETDSKIDDPANLPSEFRDYGLSEEEIKRRDEEGLSEEEWFKMIDAYPCMSPDKKAELKQRYCPSFM